LQRAFSLDVLMVPSSALATTIVDECLTCSGFSISETIHLRSFEFITNYFDGLNLSPGRSNSGTAFMGSTRNKSPSPRRAMIEDFIKEFHTTSSGVGASGLPSPRRHNVGALPAPVITMPWMESAPPSQAMTTVPPRTVAPRLDTGLPFE
jgi:hypothetical protein